MAEGFRSIIGHEKNIEFLEKLADLNRKKKGYLSGSYIFAGPEKIGKKTTLFLFLQSLLCTSQDIRPCQKCLACQQIKFRSWPDLYIVRKQEDKKNISINQVRDLIQKLSLSSFSSNYKIGVIEGAQDLNIAGANALLKLLEEPNKKVLIFLLTHHLEDLPATVVSRSQILRFRPLKQDLIYDYLLEKKVSRSRALLLSKLAGGRLGVALEYLDNPELLEKRIDLARLILDHNHQDVNVRLQSLANLFSKQTGREAVGEAFNILEVWENIVRDLFLAQLKENDLIHYQSLIPELENCKDRKGVSELLKNIQEIGQAKQYLLANVNPKLVLENVIINI